MSHDWTELERLVRANNHTLVSMYQAYSADHTSDGEVAHRIHSSERERHAPKAWNKGSKIAMIHADREEVLKVERESLPADAVFKGYEDSTVQDVILRTDNVLFHKEKFYSRIEGKTYLASVPRGYEGEFGPGIKSLVITLYFGSNMSEPKIAELLHNVRVQFSDGQVSNLLIKEKRAFHEEKDALPEAGPAHPEIELHNNPAELGARARVGKRDVRSGPRKPEGTRAWDTFMSLAETTRKLGVSFFDYVHDRILGTNLIPRLDILLTERAATMRLSPSWINS